jgi:hypothetical protein
LVSDVFRIRARLPDDEPCWSRPSCRSNALGGLEVLEPLACIRRKAVLRPTIKVVGVIPWRRKPAPNCGASTGEAERREGTSVEMHSTPLFEVG